MIKYEVGQIIPNFVGHTEGVQFDVADDGATMLVFFRNPTSSEIRQFESKNRFEIRFVELSDIIMLTIKIGNLNWMDTPYSVHLSKNLTKLQDIKENEGIGLTLILIDAATGEIKHLRLLGLSTNFTKALFKAIKEQKNKEFNEELYTKKLNLIYRKYSTKEIVRVSKNYCKIDN